jgi:hypothetical protein
MKKLLTLAIIMIAVTIVSCKKEKPTNDNSEPPIVVVDSTLLPQLQTLYMINITDTTANCECKVLNAQCNSLDLRDYGCCWSTSHNPTINDNHNYTYMMDSHGEYNVVLTNLTPGTTYYVRAYGQNEEGIGYGNEIEFVAEYEDHPNPWSPEPVNGHIPSSVLPDALAAEIGQYMNIYSGENPIVIDSLYNSSPHKLMHTTFDEPADTIYHDLRFQFVKKDNKVDLIEWVFDNYAQYYYPIAFRDLYMIGSGNNFTAYYLEENTSYSTGYYKTATILSGTFDEANNAVNNFKIAEILLKTYGNPNLPPENSYRIVGDADGVSNYYPYFGK